MPRRHALISLVIILIIGLHAVPFFRRGPGAKNIFWPILTWTMYKDSRPAGPIQVQKRRLTGVTLTGRSEEITDRVIGLGPPAVRRLYLRPMLAGDSTAVRRLLDRVNAGRDDPFVELRMEGETYTVTDSGLVKGESPVVTFRPSRPR